MLSDPTSKTRRSQIAALNRFALLALFLSVLNDLAINNSHFK